ncbi:tetratricopeptide repeat protein [Pedobacter insulae]|uniref:Flp pilus assembly protein TadD, contains TPR repeats n=1 Tax=Pedobacter insulae TaxID=414048 RepID=A0A1I2YXN9_9SPHI|nr:tetratricopeptide repeat protein [Pedobacter insulae]SFH30382.1 Flp pilus assembly protein TadD, contains TPR repeats [Pedobacter insulae]
MKSKIIFILLCCHTWLYAQDPSLLKVRDSNIVKELFFAGLKEKMLENYVSAGANFKKIIELSPENDAAFFELANVNFRQQKLLDAEINIKKAIAVNPKNIWYFKLQSEIYKRNGNMDALIPVFDKLITLSPLNEDYYFDRANALFLAGKADEALNAYDLIEKKFGTSTALTTAVQRIKLQNTEVSSDAAIEKILAENPTDVKNHLYLSGALVEKNKKEEAISVLQKAKLLEPGNYEIDLAIADIYQSQRKNELAIVPLRAAFAHPAMPVENKIKIITQMLPRFSNALVVKDATELTEVALKASPNDAKLLILYGDVLYQQGDLTRAKGQYQAAIKISEQLYIAWEKLLAMQTLTGQYNDAIKTGEDALAIYPNQAILYYYRAFALHRNGQNAEAGIEIKSALLLDGEDTKLKAMIFALQAEVLIDQQKLKEADQAFDKSIALEPNNYLTLSNYAYYLALRNHNLSKAEMLASKAAAAQPKNASIADTYAFVLFKLEKYELAKALIQRALQNNEGSNPVYLEHYGDILFVKGEKEAGLLQWQKAKQAGNDSQKLTKKINEKKYIK